MIIVDSDILVFQLRGSRQADDWLRAAYERETLAVSAVTVLEVGGGMRSGERREIIRVLSQFEVLPVTERIAWRAVDFNRTYRRSHTGISPADYLIAATAEVTGVVLATINIRHFPMFPGLTRAFEP